MIEAKGGGGYFNIQLQILFYGTMVADCILIFWWGQKIQVQPFNEGIVL